MQKLYRCLDITQDAQCCALVSGFDAKCQLLKTQMQQLRPQPYGLDHTANSEPLAQARWRCYGAPLFCFHCIDIKSVVFALGSAILAVLLPLPRPHRLETAIHKEFINNSWPLFRGRLCDVRLVLAFVRTVDLADRGSRV